MTLAALSVVLFALSVLEPPSGATVPLLRPEHRAYLSAARAERFRRMDTPTERADLFQTGSRQLPVKLAWSGETNGVCVLEVEELSAGGRKQTFSLTNLTTVYLTNLNLGRRYRWGVRSERGESVSGEFATEAEAPRLLRAEGVRNFRDLGGWMTVDGRRVRQDMIYRSAGLRSSSRLKGSLFRQTVQLGARRVTDAGLETLRSEFKIRTDLELRTEKETSGLTASLLGPDVRWVNISFAAYDFIDGRERGREPFAKIFRELLDRAHYPVLCHCSGGRDRTGTLAFLLNAILGVAEEDLCRDWELSILSDKGADFVSGRIERLLAYLHTLPGRTINEQAVSYAKFCGITESELAAFRELMLQ